MGRVTKERPNGLAELTRSLDRVRLPWGRMVLLELGGHPGARRCPLDAGQASRRMQPLSPYGCLRQGGTDNSRSGPYLFAKVPQLHEANASSL